MEMAIIDQPRPGGRTSVTLARTPMQVREAQRLRYEVFADELAAKLASADTGLDRDEFDRHCDHLVVRNDANETVGTYRILRPEGARAAGGYYSEKEFDMSRLSVLGPQLLEVGRACVRPDHRNGKTIGQLWSGLLRYVIEGRFRYVVGCASIETRDGSARVDAACRYLLDNHLAPFEWQAFPWNPYSISDAATGDESALPPLIRGYLGLGAVICGEPAWDPDFQTADVLMLLPVERMSERHVQRLLRNR